LENPVPTVQWSEKYELGVEQMDATHREFIEMLNAVFDAPDERVLAELDRFIEHTEAHFEQENQWMAETGFPPAHCHTTEHENVLNVMREVRGMVEKGQAEIGRVLAREMAPWFDIHAASMDAALAAWMSGKSFSPEVQSLCGGGAACSPSQTHTAAETA
jgi:hemerythrin-like metal-binding protein